MRNIAKRVNQTFLKAFGRTPLRQRIDDILGEAFELSRYSDMRNLREELGDLLASGLQACNELGWNSEELIGETLAKIRRREKQYHALGPKIKVAILGGAFNPVTKGHIATAQFVLDSSRTFDEAWLMPCFSHLYGKALAPARHRLKMCELAANKDGRIKVSDYEIAHKLSGETYHLIKRLQDETFAKDQYDFSFVIGLDNANSFSQWVNSEDLERLIRFVVVPRKGIKSDPRETWFLRPPHILLQPDNDIPRISSTEIRHWLQQFWCTGAAQKELERLLDPMVFDYVKRHRLYRPAPKVLRPKQQKE